PVETSASGLKWSTITSDAAAAGFAPMPPATKTKAAASWKRRGAIVREEWGSAESVGLISVFSAAMMPSFIRGLRHHFDGVVQLLAELDAAAGRHRRLEAGVDHAGLAARLLGLG